ncbi:hypothetical protein BJ170DRAFT_127334 [Xylariales sp. AK1849]|nr:hypothetical protein BJ170DRAFT_127334 [Xylariales sp. AK1849]
MADEARNTSQRPRGSSGQDQKLRHRPVTFVSAGFMDPLKELEVQQEDETFSDPVRQKVDEHIIPNRAVTDAGNEVIQPNDVAAPTVNEARTASPPRLFVLDTSGDKSLRPEEELHAIVPIDHEVGHETDSSEEVILFKGRDALRQGQAAEPQPNIPRRPKESGNSLQPQGIDIGAKVVEKPITGDRVSVAEQSTREKKRPSFRDNFYADSNRPEDDKPSPLDALLNHNTSDEEAALIADYIANMDDDDDQEADAQSGLGTHAFHKLRDLGGTDSDAVPGDVTEDEISTDISDSEADNAESSDAQRHRIELADARMARMLAKQEDLGLGGDNIVLYDGLDSGDDEGEGKWQMAPKMTPRRKKKGSTKNAKIIEKKGQYLSATAMADAFDDLDLMDWHRAALDNFNQAAKRASTVPHVSDSELEETMNMSFQKDRLKKAEKKKEREALRAQGLLGKNVNPDDIRLKYLGGMSKDDLAFELEQFLVGTDEQLILPPLDKQARKQIHLVANRLKLKSASSGKGESRYPVLYRTSRTIPYDETFDPLVNRFLDRPYFVRVDVDTETAKQQRALQRRDVNTKRGRNAISYREGEVVGGQATELGTENKGRLLLEKMGWSKGMSLGSHENKGIMVPIAHVVKKGKAGLGDV